MRAYCKLCCVLLFASATLGIDIADAGSNVTPPKNVDLTGLWVINSTLSDNPKEILEKRREKAGSNRTRRVGGSGPGGGMGRGPGGVGGIPPGGVGGPVRRMPDRQVESDSGRSEPTNETLDELLAWPEQLDIKQEMHTYTISSINQTSSCKPGEAAVQVPMRDGYLADQHCGWKSKQFVIELKSPIGLTRIDRYELSKKTDQLVVITELKGGRGPLKGLKLKRTYDRMIGR